jgi:hypothetical protein
MDSQPSADEEEVQLLPVEQQDEVGAREDAPAEDEPEAEYYRRQVDAS